MHELLTSKQMSEADRLTIISGTPGLTLMERAGKAVAKRAGQMFPMNGLILVLCGPGNNGGDGFVAARLLQEQGRHVNLALLGERAQLKGDAAIAASKWSGPVVGFCPVELQGVAGIIDALFGAGLTRDITGNTVKMIDQVNQTGVPILAVDLPSGIDGSNGALRGTAIKATHTISFFRPKPGHLLFPGRDYCGSTEIANIGISKKVLDDIRPQTFHNDPALWRSCFPRPAFSDHKYDRGHGVVISGGPDSTGAARLAAMAALRIGAGLVTLASPVDALAINAAHLTAIMVKSFADRPSLGSLLEDERKNCVVIGPGNGVNDETCNTVLDLLGTDKAVVIDADALTSFCNRPTVLFEAIRKRHAPTILTPHDGEYQRLFKHDLSLAETKDDSRLARARSGAAMSGAILILKGPDSVIAEPTGRAVINNNAPPFLATAGSGDVLAGMVGGLLAQHMSPFEAACAAVWLHGDAAADFGPGLISEDLPKALPAAIDRLNATLKMKEQLHD